MYYTYMIRCEDNSIYTGYTNDIEGRMKAHFGKSKVAAKYTKSHKPTKIEVIWRTREKANACKLEYRIKQLNKTEKEDLIKKQKLGKYFSGKLDCRKFRKENKDSIIISRL